MIVALFAVLSCEEEKIPELVPSIQLGETEITISSEGGEVSLDYSLENPRDGASITVEPVNPVDWVSDINVFQEGVISLSVAENDSEQQRKAEFQITYPGIEENIFFTILQEASNVPFEITIKEIEKTSITLDVTPEDKEMSYILFMSPSDYVNGFEDDDDLFADDMDYFESSGTDISEIAFKGELTDYVYSPVLPSTEYVVYSYGIDVETKSRLTDIVRVNVSSAELELIDVDFDVKTTVNGATITAKVVPESYDGWYYIDIYEYIDSEKNDMTQVCFQLFYEKVSLYLALGVAPSDIMTLLASKGEINETYDLEPEKKYTLVVFAIDDTPLLCSEPYVASFETEAIKPSENVLSIKFDDITAHSAKLTITPTNNDSFAWYQVEEGLYTNFDSEAELVEYILSYNPPYNLYTSETIAELSGLKAESTYYVIAFGYSGGELTTSVFKNSFTTNQEQVSDVSFKVNYDKYYAIEDVVAKDPTFEYYAGNWDCLIPLEAETDFEKVKEYYYGCYDISDIGSLSDDEVKNRLITDFSSGNPTSVSIASYGYTMIAVGFAVDLEGNWTKLYRSKPLTLTEEGASHDADEFLDWYYGDAEQSKVAWVKPVIHVPGLMSIKSVNDIVNGR